MKISQFSYERKQAGIELSCSWIVSWAVGKWELIKWIDFDWTLEKGYGKTSLDVWAVYIQGKTNPLYSLSSCSEEKYIQDLNKIPFFKADMFFYDMEYPRKVRSYINAKYILELRGQRTESSEEIRSRWFFVVRNKKTGF